MIQIDRFQILHHVAFQQNHTPHGVLAEEQADAPSLTRT